MAMADSKDIPLLEMSKRVYGCVQSRYCQLFPLLAGPDLSLVA